MTRQHVIALGLAALAWPALAQQAAYPIQDEQGAPWSAPPPPDASGAYAPGADVDVSVDLASPGSNVTFDTFREGLAPYGEWVTMPRYGRVWRPAHVAAGWRPYYYGRWEWTNEGWLWVSDEPWGWAAYHYGRWAYDGGYGWVWIPGYQWAPAWVTWRYSPDYVGWAPLGPGFSVYVTTYPAVYGWWTFVPCHRFVGVPVWSVAYGGSHVRGIYHATLPAPPRASMYGAATPAWGGPARPFLESRVGHAIAPVRVQPVASPAAVGAAARPGVVPIYRPEVRPAPARPGSSPGVAGPRPATSPGMATVRPAPSGTPGGVASPGGAPVRPWGGGASPRPVTTPSPGANAYRAPGSPAPAAGYRAPPPPSGGRAAPAPSSGGRAVTPPPAAPRPAPAAAPARPQGSSYAPRAAPRVQGHAAAARGAPVASSAGRAAGGGARAAVAHRR